MHKSRSVKIDPPYRRRIELPYCCVPAVLAMVFERREIKVPEQEDIGYELGLTVPGEVAHRFHRVRTGEEPVSGWGTQTYKEEFSIQRYFERHNLPLQIVKYKVRDIGNLEKFLIRHLKKGNDIIVCFDSQNLLGRGDMEHVALVQALAKGTVTLIDPAEGSPDFYHEDLSILTKAVSIRSTDQLGFWVISSSVDYDRISRIYDVSRAAHPETVQKLVKVLHVASNSALLDMGCGTGNYTAALAEKARSITGIDKSPSMIRKARAKHPELQFICGDVTNLPFDAETFDAAFAIQVLHHVEKKKAFLQEAYRVLRKPGYIALHFCSHQQMRSFFFTHYFPRGLEIELRRMPDAADITSMLEEAGFSDVDLEICYQDIVVANETPERYLDKNYRDGVSTFSFLTPEEIEQGCKRLRQDIASGAVEDVVKKQGEKVAEIGGSTVIYGRKL